MVKNGKDIHPILTRRMDMWEARKLPELLHEAKRCDKEMVAALSPLPFEQLERTFNRLMLEGRIRTAVRFIIERGGVGVLDPEAEIHGKNGPLCRELLILVPSLAVKCCRH